MKNQKGFSAIVSLLIVVIIGIVGGVGWFLYGQKGPKVINKASPSQTSPVATPVKNTDAVEKKDETTTKGTLLTSRNSAFKMKIPDGWNVTNDTDQDYALAIGLPNMTYNKGRAATIENKVGHRGGGLTTSSFVMQSGNKKELESYFASSKKIGTITTVKSVEGAKFLFASSGQNDPDALPVGAKSYGYQFVSGDKVVVVNYIILAADPDQTSVVEQALKTLEL